MSCVFNSCKFIFKGVVIFLTTSKLYDMSYFFSMNDSFPFVHFFGRQKFFMLPHSTTVGSNSVCRKIT